MAHAQCTEDHPPRACSDLYCYILRSDLFAKTVLQAFEVLYQGGYTVRIRDNRRGVDLMLLAQKLIGTYLKFEVSDQQIVFNLPRKLAFTVTQDSAAVFELR